MPSHEKPARALAEINSHFGITANLFVHRNGRRLPVAKNVRNLILDSGMVTFGDTDLSLFQDWCHKGDGSDSNSLDSGTTTASQSGTTVTASGSIFSAGDVGSIIKYDSGEEYYITSFTSATVVEVDTSATVASSEFTLWRVDRVTLANELARTSNTQGTNGWAVESTTLVRTRTHIFPANVGGETIREIGWGDTNTTAINARVVLLSPIALTVGDQLEVESRLEINQSPQTATPSDPTTNEGNFAGQVQTEDYGIGTLGGVGTCLQPTVASGNTRRLILNTSTDALASYGAGIVPTGTVLLNQTLTDGSSPTSKPWEKTSGATVATGSGNGSIGSIYISGISSGSIDSGFRLRLTTPQTKTSLQTLAVTFKMTWTRNLTN